MFKDVDLAQYKGVLLDLDNTLYLYDGVHQLAQKAMLLQFSEQIKLPISKAETIYLQARETVHQLLHGQAASHSRLLYSIKSEKKPGI